MVDLSKVKAGDKVKFRCGGEATLHERPFGGKLVFCRFNKGGYSHAYHDHHNGRVNYKEEADDAFDIIAIEPGSFDWATVRPGMAWIYPKLTYQHGGPVFYIAKNPADLKRHVFSSKGHGFYQFDEEEISEMKRAPEHDIEVPNV